MSIKILKEPARKPAAPERYPHIAIVDQDVVLLQVRDNGRVPLQDLVFALFEALASDRRGEVAWLAFHADGMPHHEGKSTWIGLSTSVPLGAVDTIQATLQKAGMEVERAMGRAVRLDLSPLARLSEDGRAILVPAALVGDPNQRRVIDRAGTSAVARGYTVAPSKAASLEALLLGR